MGNHVRFVFVSAVSLGYLACSSAASPAAPVATASPGAATAPGAVGGTARPANLPEPAAAAGPSTGAVAGATAATPRAGANAAGISGGAGRTAGVAGSSATSGQAGAPVVMATAGTGGAAVRAGSGAGGSAGAGAAPMGANNLTGMLGKLGPVQPVMAGWATTNGLENLIYLSTAPLTCKMMQTMGTKWLATLPAGSQVIELVTNSQLIKEGSFKIGFPTGEVSYAEGSKSSSTEVQATGGGGITYTKIVPKMIYEGMVNVTAPYMLSGMFHAEWCEGATEY